MLGDNLADAGLHRLKLLIESYNVGRVVDGELLASLADLVRRPNPKQELPGRRSGEYTRLQLAEAFPVSRATVYRAIQGGGAGRLGKAT